MKSVMYEWKKFRAFRYFWFLCSVFFLFNIWTLSEKMKMEMYDAGAVKQIYADLKAQPEEKRKEWIEKLPEKKVPVYTGNEYAEEMLYNKIFQEYRQVNRYDKYLEEIKEKSASMSSAIFSNEGTFASLYTETYTKKNKLHCMSSFHLHILINGGSSAFRIPVYLSVSHNP